MDHYDLYCFHYFLKECSIKFSKSVSIGGGGGGGGRTSTLGMYLVRVLQDPYSGSNFL